ncbi:hypothetical protein O6H91_03G084200 [Diphasiastrum complanatum]|uniref:Uncharacterized protein n=6 Tax=Diphasiastrum complanatum TaxID=34168 RepID=A0ACC2E8G8_DIPCM|nr:hypothetical protein O6H91_03G084200 [Diphasiastrum complanatum]KAJ7562771.1 hypothetical protein O6H91_03G084200 [Diphasiastrum complanatum]KAJ7562772.1 hypothetical protein O6H91_03G084200 [Diphasiastrum complanatum]KAJ7562773.1 hypothetical protein O6H91_03G084200 [Diphasiastrum complanatum]KAJ7562774.1 hypothetical protein O6H91_03G084200 [Diphasiastrum complanatum]
MEGGSVYKTRSEKGECGERETMQRVMDKGVDENVHSQKLRDVYHDDNGEHESHFDDQSPIEQVALTVPTSDDPTLPVLTFRVWVIGTLACVMLMFLNTFFSYRTQPLTVSAISAQIIALPLGHFMAAVIPKQTLHLPLTGWQFSLNPGPFNMKEHVLITIFANAGVSFGGGDAYSVGAINVIKAFYNKRISFIAGLLIVITTQMLGYGWAGMLRKYLVEPAHMWWPSNLVQVSLFRTLHERDEHKGLKRIHFFLIFMIVSFAYYSLPAYLFTILTFFSWICWAFPNSVTAHQIGSGFHGLGVGATTLDWAGISSYLGSPLVTPWFSIVNIGIGFVLFLYIVIPATYWENVYSARTFPIFSSQLFTSHGQKYNTSHIMTPQFELDLGAYEKYGKLHLSTFFALSTGFGFARIAATLTHVILFNGKDIWFRSRSIMTGEGQDVHTRLMRKYPEVPQWWFLILLFGSMVLSIVVCVIWEEEVQLPWWCVLLACALAWVLTLPIGVITATTNQQPGFNVVAEFMIGYLLPGRPIANTLFKTYGKISMSHAISFLADLKLGHYMKIPPRCMYTAQLFGTIIAGTVNMSAAWWMLQSINNICDVEKLPPSSPWTCPKDRVAFDASVIWGLVGPKRLFGPLGDYKTLTWFFLLGALLPIPVWMLSKLFPKATWIGLINMPVLLGGFASMPPATPVNIASWLVVGIIFNYFVFRFHKGWWQRYNYVLSASLDAGTAFMGVLLYFSLSLHNKKLNWWGTQLDHCPLASCPTAQGIVVKGCPVF